jgi:hypothetical protein
MVCRVELALCRADEAGEFFLCSRHLGAGRDYLLLEQCPAVGCAMLFRRPFDHSQVRYHLSCDGPFKPWRRRKRSE